MGTTRTATRQALLAVTAVFGGLVIVAALLPAGEAQAATIDVDQVEDAYDDGSKTCSLREAIVSANRNISIDSCDAGSPSETDVINVPHQVNGYDLTLAGVGEDSGETGDLDITEDVTIQGAGPITEPAEIDAGGSVDTDPECNNKRTFDEGVDRVLHVHEPVTPPTTGAPASGPQALGVGGVIDVQLTNLTITGGSVGSDESFLGGGGILAETANLSLDTVSVEGNSVTNFEEEGDAFGGGISIDPDSRLVVEGGSIEGNYADAEFAAGGGIFQHQEEQDPDGPEALGEPPIDIDISGNENGDALLEANRVCAAFMASGGAVSVSTSLDVDEARFDGNAVGSSLGFGGAISSPLFAQGIDVEVRDSVFQSNEAASLGGEFFLAGAAGGAMATVGNTFIDRTTFEENQAIGLGSESPVGASGGGVAANGFLDMENSTFNDNTAFSGDLTPEANNAASLGGQEPVETPNSFGGGLAVQGAEVELLNSTFSGNYAYNGGGIAHGFQPAQPPPKLGPQVQGDLGNSGFDFITVTDNSATNGGGIWIGEEPNEVHLYASIVGDQESGDDCFQAGKGGAFLDEGENLDSDSSCVDDPTSGTDDPELDELDDNGGPTETHALLALSPAIDKVNNNKGCPPEDQRGEARFQDGDGNGTDRCDSGAFELKIHVPDPLFCPGFKNDPRPQIIGTAANNTLNGTNAAEIICGKAGTDTINGGGGDDLILGGPDNDKIKGQGGDDRVVAGGGADEVNGNGGNDRLRGYPGNDKLNGDDGEDRITGGIDNDTVNGDAGDDKVFGWDGNDNVNGNGGSDHTFGSLGDDTVDGGGGNDRVRGYKGDDNLFGRDGEDKLVGNLGDDDLNGGPDTDTCFGGPGTNTFTNCP